MTLPILQDEPSSPWYSDGLSFTCTQCGNCCTGGPGYVWISKIEIQRLSDHLKLSVEETIDRYCRKIGKRYSLKEHRNHGLYDCTFLEEHQGKRVCTIYPVRPLQCRTWPFWDGLLSSEKSWNIAARGCPGMNVGKKHSLQHIESMRTATDWPEK